MGKFGATVARCSSLDDGHGIFGSGCLKPPNLSAVARERGLSADRIDGLAVRVVELIQFQEGHGFAFLGTKKRDTTWVVMYIKVCPEE